MLGRQSNMAVIGWGVLEAPVWMARGYSRLSWCSHQGVTEHHAYGFIVPMLMEKINDCFYLHLHHKPISLKHVCYLPGPENISVSALNVRDPLLSVQ